MWKQYTADCSQSLFVGFILKLNKKSKNVPVDWVIIFMEVKTERLFTGSLD
jgi:hypothetical protein